MAIAAADAAYPIAMRADGRRHRPHNLDWSIAARVRPPGVGREQRGVPWMRWDAVKYALLDDFQVGSLIAEPNLRGGGFPWAPLTPTGGIQWLATNTIKQPNTMKMLPSPTALPRNITARAITQRAKSTQAVPSNTLKTLANIASRLTPRASSRSRLRGPA